MSKKVFLITIILGGILSVLAIAPAFSQDFEGNKCYDEWDWCGDGTTDVSNYWWEAGWCAAALEAKVISGTIASCTSTTDDDPVIVVIEESSKTKKQKKKYCQINIGAAYEEEDYYLVFKTTKNIPYDDSPVDESLSDTGKKECPWYDEFLEDVAEESEDIPE